MIFKSGDCVRQGRCLSASSCSSNQDWTLLAVYGQIVIFKNCIIGRKQHLDCKMHMVTKNVHIATGCNWTLPSNYRTGRIPRYCCLNHHRPPPCFTIGTGSQDCRLPWAFSRHKPGLMLGTAWKTTHLTIFRISNHQTSRLYDHHTIFCLLVLFSVIKGLAIAALPWIGLVKLLSDCFFRNRVFKMNIEYCCHLCCSTIIFKTVLSIYNDTFHLVLVFRHYST
jgi:hypothetical protein